MGSNPLSSANIKTMTKIEVAIDNVKQRIAKAEREILLYQREKDTLFDILMALEKIEADKNL